MYLLKGSKLFLFSDCSALVSVPRLEVLEELRLLRTRQSFSLLSTLSKKLFPTTFC